MNHIKDRGARNGGVSHCWHCEKQLMRRKEGGFFFTHIQDPDGHKIRVHQECQDAAVGHGYTIPPVEAA